MFPRVFLVGASSHPAADRKSWSHLQAKDSTAIHRPSEQLGARNLRQTL